ncbi:Coq4 [Symbiodinium microadriaticum]|nr:Coq4 [Symbiodinium microadriaticum]
MAPEAPTLDRQFAEGLLRTFDDPQKFGVHLLFNDWWKYAPQDVIDKFMADWKSKPDHVAFIEEQHYADPITIEALAAMPDGSLGKAYHGFLVDNGLEEKLAQNYKLLHDMMLKSGMLDKMPEPLQYAILRGFQVHDILHVLTGYEPTPGGEIALQAFCLAQIRFPYFSMWLSVVTTRMTYLDPDAIIPTMDEVSQGWQFGRAVPNLQFEKWEDHFERPLAEVRKDYGIAPEGKKPLDGYSLLAA